MSQYEYEAEDSARQVRSGRIAAASANEAVKELSSQGLRIRRLRPLQPGSAGAPAAGCSTPPAPLSAPSSGPSPAPASAPPRNQSGTIPSSSSWAGEVRTSPTRPKDLLLFFTQLSSLLDSGISAVQAFHSLSGQRMHKGLSQACAEMAPRLTEGRKISDEMERYPDLFPPGVVGAIRSGEVSGNLPEVCRVVAEQNHQAYKLDRRVWWAWVAMWNTTLGFAILYPVVGVVNKGIDYVAGKEQNVSFVDSYLNQLNTPVGWLLFSFVALLWWWGWARRRTFTRSFRHRMAFKLPILKKRTAGENLMLFSWHLSHLSKSGRSPWEAFSLAAKAAPNMAWTEALLTSSGSLKDTSQFSSIVAQAKLIPPEWQGLIQTGEMTGRLPQALEQASSLSRDEAKHAEETAMWRLGCWASLVVLGGGLLMFAMVYGTYLLGAFRVLEE